MYIKYNFVRDEFAKKLDKIFGVQNCLIEVNPGKVLLPPKYQEVGERISNMQVRKDDVWLVSYPRTGSTWVQEMVWCIGNNLNLEIAKSTIGQARNPLLELTALLGNDHGTWKDQIGDSVTQVENMPSPRFIKTHLPLELLPLQMDKVKPKIIYVTRNPKDMCVSYYHYCRLIHDMTGTFDDFCELFLAGKAPIGPIWNHIFGFWNKRNDPNVLFLKYEDIKKDLRKTIKDVSNFMEHSLSDPDINKLVEHLSFNQMRKNPAVNLEYFLKLRNGPSFEQNGDETFIRKGQVGDWKNYMTKDLSDKFDKWIESNLKNTDLTFEIK